MRAFFKKYGSYIFPVIVLVFVLPGLVLRSVENSKLEGSTLTSAQYLLLAPGAALTAVPFPPSGKSITLFWATWCGPCKIEMSRLKKSVESGEIPRDKIFAISPFEERSIVKKFLAKSDYPFNFIDAPDVGQKLKLEAVPTTLFIQDGKIIRLSTGMSIFGIWKSESFLN